MTQSPVRFAILGFGHHAVRRLLPAFRSASSDADRDVAPRPGCRRTELRRAQDAHCFATREELCSSPDVDVVFITSPDAMHRDDTLLALETWQSRAVRKARWR